MPGDEENITECDQKKYGESDDREAKFTRIALKEIDEKEKHPGLALLSGARNEDPNRILSNLISFGDETKFLLAFDRAKNLYGEARLDAAHHLKRAEILLKYQNYEKVAGTYLGFLMIYPDRPEAPEVKFSLAELYIHELGQLKKGIRYLEDIVFLHEEWLANKDFESIARCVSGYIQKYFKIVVDKRA